VQTDDIDQDHVPQQAVFDLSDHNFPLKLAAHKAHCHSLVNLDDEVLGQLVSMIHGKRAPARNDKLKIELYQNANSKALLASFNQRDIGFLIRRWLKGFHAALYRNPLPDGTEFVVQSPFPSGTIRHGQLKEDSIRDQHYAFVECINRNRVVQNLDKVVSNNQKLRYECVWDQLSDKSWACIFALDLYGWIDLGDVNNFRPRGCVGLYKTPDGNAPVVASRATKLEFKLAASNAADPFAT